MIFFILHGVLIPSKPFYSHIDDHDLICSIRYILTSSADMTARVFRMDAPKDYVPQALAGHRGAVKGAWFSEDMQNVRIDPLDSMCGDIDRGSIDIYSEQGWCSFPLALYHKSSSYSREF